MTPLPSMNVSPVRPEYQAMTPMASSRPMVSMRRQIDRDSSSLPASSSPALCGEAARSELRERRRLRGLSFLGGLGLSPASLRSR